MNKFFKISLAGVTILIVFVIIMFVISPKTSAPGGIGPFEKQTSQSGFNEKSPGSCQSNPNPVFTNHFTDTNAIDSIIPPFFAAGGNEYKSSSLVNTIGRVPVYLPIAGKLIQGSHYQDSGQGDYLLDFEVSCEVMFSLDHITEPIPAITKLLPSTPQASSRTQFFKPAPTFAAGDLIGYTTGTLKAHNWNVAVYNKSKPHTLISDPEFSQHDKNRIFDCPFNYYPDNMKQQYTGKFTGSSGDIVIIKNICAP